MRKFGIVAVALGLMAGVPAAQAAVEITVDKDNQQMTVAVDGIEKYRWPVSTGLPSYETPNGNFQTFRMEEDHFSKEFDDAPMPHAIFFTKRGHAIHGTDSVSRLGSPASHGCVRLSRANAATLFDLVKREGVLKTKVTLTGSSQVALARNPKPSRKTAVARRDDIETPDVKVEAPNIQVPNVQMRAPAARAVEPEFDAAGNPLPQRRTRRVYRQQQYAPQQEARADDGYFYSQDPNDGRRYPAPPGYYRRGYEAQGYGQPYYPSPQRSYGRGLFNDQGW